jgi:hypothetical protein
MSRSIARPAAPAKACPFDVRLTRGIGRVLHPIFSSWPCRRPSTTSINHLVLLEKSGCAARGVNQTTPRLRPVVVDGRLRGQDEKGEFLSNATARKGLVIAAMHLDIGLRDARLLQLTARNAA